MTLADWKPGGNTSPIEDPGPTPVHVIRPTFDLTPEDEIVVTGVNYSPFHSMIHPHNKMGESTEDRRCKRSYHMYIHQELGQELSGSDNFVHRLSAFVCKHL